MRLLNVILLAVFSIIVLTCLFDMAEAKGGGRGSYGSRGWGSGNIKRGYSRYYESR